MSCFHIITEDLIPQSDLPTSRRKKDFIQSKDVMRHGVDVISPSSWEPQEEAMMSIVANFPSVRNQGLSNPGKSQTSEGDAC
jgi:hypothetical protein